MTLRKAVPTLVLPTVTLRLEQYPQFWVPLPIPRPPVQSPALNWMSGRALTAPPWGPAVLGPQIWLPIAPPLWQRSIPQPNQFAFTFQGGNVYNVTVSETGSLSDVVTSTATLNLAVVEAGTLSDAQSSLAVFIAAVTETGSLTDTVTAAAVWSVTITEAGSLADSQTALVNWAVQVNETGTLADAVTSSAVFAVQVNETGSLVDALTSVGTYTVTVLEAGNLQDSQFQIDPNAAGSQNMFKTGFSYSTKVGIL